MSQAFTPGLGLIPCSAGNIYRVLGERYPGAVLHLSTCKLKIDRGQEFIGVGQVANHFVFNLTGETAQTMETTSQS